MAAGDSIDYEGIREALLDLGDDLYRLGYDWFLDGIEGNNRIGRAFSNPRTKDEILLLRRYMVAAARKFKVMEKQTPGDQHLMKAMVRLDEAWRDFHLCLNGV